MKPIEMAAECARVMGTPGIENVSLTFPKGGLPSGFPRGELLNEMTRCGVVEQTTSFNAEQVLAWLVSNGLINMERTGNGYRLSEVK